MTTCAPRFIEGRLYCMGQPDHEDLQALARKGVRRVINLRPHSELNWDEAACAAACGLDYINIPVATPADLDRAHATALREADMTFAVKRAGGWVSLHERFDEFPGGDAASTTDGGSS